MKIASAQTRVRQSIEADILSWGVVRAWPEELLQWRKQPGPMTPEPFSPSLIRHCEDQTIAGLWATCQAVAGMEPKAGDFAEWGVVAAPQLMGRSGNAAAFERFTQEGPWGISPHVIPHQSLHAISGLVSQILKTHGPNFGVGNGLDSAVEGWLTAATFLSDSRLPGLWLLLTGHAAEYIPARPGESEPRVECEAVALALAPAREYRAGLHLRLCPEDLIPGGGHGAFLASLPGFSLSSLIDELSRRDGPPAQMWRLPGAGWIEIEVR